MASVLIDRRTGSKDLAALLPKGYAELTDLEFGDAVVVGNGPDGPVTEAFERKRLDDAMQCVDTGRFAGGQLIGLREAYDVVWLVIEDEIRANPDNGLLQRVFKREIVFVKNGVYCEKVFWSDVKVGKRRRTTWRDFYHWLLSMRHVGGVDLIAFTRNARETADLIWTVNTWRQKDWKQHKSTKVFNRAHGVKGSALFKPPRVMEFAGRFDGIGYDTAAAIADRYASLEEFFEDVIHSNTVTDRLAKLVVTTRKDGVKVRMGRKDAESIVQQTKQRRNVK